MSPRSLPRFAAFYHAHFAAFRQEHRGMARSGVSLVRAAQRPHASIVPAVAEWRLSLACGDPVLVRRALGGAWQEGVKPPRSFTLTPPASATPVEVTAPHAVRVLALEAPRVDALLAGIGARGRAPLEPLAAQLWLRDAAIAALLDRFWAEASGTDAVAAMLADGMTMMLVAQLLRLAGHAPPEPDPRALAPRRLRRALDLIDAQLDQDIGLADIAAAAGLSQHHFARAFRAATGLPPYRYLTQRRIERAQRMIAGSEASLAQIAFACGFGSQAQFTTTFTRMVGVSPGRWRAQRRG